MPDSALEAVVIAIILTPLHGKQNSTFLLKNMMLILIKRPDEWYRLCIQIEEVKYLRFLRLLERWCYKMQGSTTVKKNNIKSEIKIRGYSAPTLKYIFEIFSQVVILIRWQGKIRCLPICKGLSQVLVLHKNFCGLFNIIILASLFKVSLYTSLKALNFLSFLTVICICVLFMAPAPLPTPPHNN